MGRPRKYEGPVGLGRPRGPSSRWSRAADSGETPGRRAGIGPGKYSEESFECLLPSQIGGSAARECGPELRLMLAVFEMAVSDATGRLDPLAVVEPWMSAARRRVREEALAYFASDDTTWPYSARNVADVVGLDLDAVRQAIARGQVHHVRTAYRGPGMGRPSVVGS